MSLVFFPFFREGSFNGQQNPRVDPFLRQEETWKDSKRRFFRLLSLSLVLDGLFTTPIYSHRRSRFVNSAFPNKKIWTKNRSLFMTNKFESKCLQKFTFQVNRKKNGTGRRRLTSRNRLAIFVNTNSCEERHNKPFWL